MVARYKAHIYEVSYKVAGRVASKSDAMCWGRIAAVLDWGLSSLDDEVEPEFHEVAKTAYNRRMLKLHGAPF
jgi:hypothetical protein